MYSLKIHSIKEENDEIIGLLFFRLVCRWIDSNWRMSDSWLFRVLSNPKWATLAGYNTQTFLPGFWGELSAENLLIFLVDGVPSVPTGKFKGSAS